MSSLDCTQLVSYHFNLQSPLVCHSHSEPLPDKTRALEWIYFSNIEYAQAVANAMTELKRRVIMKKTQEVAREYLFGWVTQDTLGTMVKCRQCAGCKAHYFCWMNATTVISLNSLVGPLRCSCWSLRGSDYNSAIGAGIITVQMMPLMGRLPPTVWRKRRSGMVFVKLLVFVRELTWLAVSSKARWRRWRTEKLRSTNQVVIVARW